MVRVVRSREEARERALRSLELRKRRELERERNKKQKKEETEKTGREDDGGNASTAAEPERSPLPLPLRLCCTCLTSQAPFTGETFSLLSLHVFKFLLYMRGQIPDMYDNLQVASSRRQNNSAAGKIILNGPRGRVARLKLQVKQAFLVIAQHFARISISRSDEAEHEEEDEEEEALPAIFTAEILFVFGSSVRKPRETYLLTSQIRATAAAAAGGGGGSSGESSESEVKRTAAKINRELVTAIMQMEEEKKETAQRRKGGGGGLPKNCKVHILLRTKTPAAAMERSSSAGLFPQVGVNLKRSDAVVVQVKAKEAPQKILSEEEEGQWYQCNACVRGIK